MAFDTRRKLAYLRKVYAGNGCWNGQASEGKIMEASDGGLNPQTVETKPHFSKNQYILLGFASP